VADQAEILPEAEFQTRDAAAGRLGAETGEQPARKGGGADDERQTAEEKRRPVQLCEIDQPVEIERMDTGLETDRRGAGGEPVEGVAEDGTGGGRQAVDERCDRIRAHPSFFSCCPGAARGESSASRRGFAEVMQSLSGARLPAPRVQE